MIKLKDIVTEIHDDHIDLGNEYPFLLIPDYDYSNKKYPGNIKPGRYNAKQVQQMVLRNKDNPDALIFLADMLETGDSSADDAKRSLVRVLRVPRLRQTFLKMLAADAALDSPFSQN